MRALDPRGMLNPGKILDLDPWAALLASEAGCMTIRR